MRIFQDMGAEIEAAWSQAGRDVAALPAIVTRELRARRPHLLVGVMDVIEWVLSTPDLPRQHDLHATFGEPPVTVYDGPHLYIQVLCWRSGTTAIHGHGFVGGFIVLEGSSLHTCYRFDPRQRVSSRLQVGDVRLLRAELLTPGSVVAITHDLKHTIFHLEAPSATLVVRSFGEGEDPQLTCFAPSVAVDPFDVDPVALRRRQVLRFLLHCQQGRHDELAARLLERCDLATAWEVLKQSHDEIDEPGRAARLADVARRHHGQVIDDFLAVIDEQRRMRRALRLHAALGDPELRFFLSLLHSVPHKDAIFDLIGRRYPGVDPRARVLAWAEQLSGVDRIGVDLSDEVNRVLFEAMLDGSSPAFVLGRLEAAFDRESVAAQADDIMAHCRRIEQTVLAPLFRAAPERAPEPPPGR